MPSPYDLLLEEPPETSRYDRLLEPTPASSEAALPVPELANQPVPTALPGPGNVPTEPITRESLSRVLGDLISLPGKTAQTAVNSLGGLVTGDIVNSPEAYLATPPEEDIQVPGIPAAGMKMLMPYLYAGDLAKAAFPNSSLAARLRGLTESAAEGAASLTSMQNAAALPFGAGGKMTQLALAGLFETQAALHLPEQLAAAKAETDPEKQTKMFGEIALGLGLPAAAGIHAALKGKTTKGVTDETQTQGKGQETIATPEAGLLTEPATSVQTAAAPEVLTPTARIAAAQRDIATARANGDAAGEARATEELSAVANELINGATADRTAAQTNLTRSAEINPVREVTPETVLHPADTEMVKGATDSLGLRYDGIQDGVALNITNPKTGDTYTMAQGSTVADLQAKIAEKEAARTSGVAVAEPPVETPTVQPAPQQDVLSPGPGAASVKEPLASYELRRFGERFQEDQSIDPAIREQTGNRYYEPISNKVTVAEAEGIIETRGTDESVRLVRDEAFPMQPRVRVTVGEALIKKLNQSHQEAKAAGDVRAGEFLEQAVDTAEYLSEFGTTLGQGVQAFAIWNKLTPEGRLLEATRLAKKSGIELTPEQQKRIGELNAEIEKAPEGFQKTEKTQDLMSYMAEIKGINPADVPIALWYSNILSGFTTQLVNTIDTGLNVFSESAVMAASHPTAIPAIVGGLYRGMIKGGFEAASTLKTGRSISGDKIGQQRVLERVTFGKEGGVPISTDTPLGAFLKGAFESKVATPLNLWKYPLRAMVASDTVFFNSMKEARARFLARGIAKTEGLSGDALFRRVQETLNQSPETLDVALKQAQDEGLTGLQQRRRVQEIVEQGRSEELVDASNEAAQIATYNHEPSGVIGLVAHNIANITEGFPPGKAIAPFTRIVANVTNRGLNYTPWGYKRLFFGEWGGKKFSSDPPTGEAYRTQLVKATLGTTAMTAVALLDSNDTIQVTAGGPGSIDEKRQLQNAGWKPYSVKIGDTYYSYQYTPFNLGFAMVGHYRDAIRYNKLSEKDATTRLAYGMLKSSSTILDMSFLSGVSDFLETIQGTTSSTKGASRLFSRTVSSVVVPNLVKQIDKLFDPTIYQGDSITQSLIRETPVARSIALKPMLNVLGEEIKPSQNRFFTFDTKDPVWQFIVEKQAWVPVPSKTTKIKDRPITPDEYYRLIKESGSMIRDYIQSNLGKLRDMTGEDAQEDIQKESQRIRSIVKSRF